MFEDWGDLLVEGVKAWVVGIVYMLVPLVVAGVTVGGTIVSMGAGSNPNLAVGQLFLGFLLSTVLALVFGYVAVAAVVNFARVGTLGAGFAVGDIRPVLFSRNYAMGWLLSVVVVLVAGAITSALNAIPVLGTLIGAFVTFYALVVAARLWADGFADARHRTDGTDHSGIEESTV